MAEDTQGFDAYESVLADLRAKRDQIEQTIQALEALRGGTATPGRVVAPSHQAPEEGAFLGMTIPDAARKLLASRKRTLTNADIVAAFKAGGLAMTSADPMNTVGSVLTRRFNTVGDIVRVNRGVWGLAEWYPNRNFKKKKTENGTEPATASSETSESE